MQSLLPRPNTGTILFAAIWTLTSSERIVVRTSVTFVDVLAAIASMLLILQLFGRIPYYYNKWHFMKYGWFDVAGLPEVVYDNLLDPNSKIELPGKEGLAEYRRSMNPTSIPRAELRSAVSEIVQLRTKIHDVLKRARK